MLVVTGASGLLGVSMLQAAADQGVEAVGLCRQHELRHCGFNTAVVDLIDDSATRQLITDMKPDAIVHCAAATNVDWCEENAAAAKAVNVDASAWLASIAADLKARFLYVSTDAVFDGEKGGYVETDDPRPLNVYAKTKLAGEQEAVRHHPDTLIARVNIYGWNAQRKLSLAEWILQKLEAGEEVRGFTDVLFNPTLVNQLAPILLRMLQHGLTGMYHVVGSEKISKFEFARRLARMFELDPTLVKPCQVKEVALKATRPLDISLSTQKVAAAINSSMPGVDEGLREFRALRDRHYPEQLKSYLAEGVSQ